MIKRSIILIVFILVAASIFAQNKVRINLLSSKNKSVNVENIQSDNNGIRIKESISFIEFEEKETKEGTFIQLYSDGMTKSYDKGKPNLPLISRLIEIPLNSKAVIKVISYDEKIIELKDHNLLKEIIPAQPSLSKSDDPKDIPFYKDQSIYKKNEFFKNDIIKFEDRGYLRNKHLAYIEISPFRYNPVTNSLKVLNNIEIEISFIPDSKARIINTKNLESPYFENIVNTINQSTESKALIFDPVKYVIVSDRMFEEALQSFIEWKTLKGFNVVEAYTDDTNVGNTTTSIKAYLQDLYDNPSDGVSPTFVLFVGDVAQIPAFSGTTGGHVTDLYYCEYTGDKLPEVFYGRFSATSVEELQPQIDKTLEVEKYEMPDPSYLDNVVLIAGHDGNGHAPTHGNGFVSYASDYYINSDNGINALLYYDPEASTSDAQIRTDISNGVALANYTAHCNSNGWGDPSFTNSNIASMTNEHMYPLMIGNCCLSNKFDVASCFGESLLRAVGKGAVGYIGASNNSLWDEDYYWAIGLTSSITTTPPTYENSELGAYDRFFHRNNESNEDWYITQGQIIVAGNLAVEASSSDEKSYYWEIYHLMGDPSLTPFVTVPEVLTASYNSEIIIGSSTFQVVTEEDAYIAVSKDGILLDAKLANESGIVNLSFDVLANVGVLDIVITKQNRQPKIDKVNIIPASTPYIVLDDFVIDDNLGNANGEADFNESVKLDVELKNISDAYDAFLVNATITTLDTNVVITDSIETYGTILKSDSLLIESAFGVDVKSKIENQHTVLFDLKITGEDSEGVELEWNSNFTLVLNAPQIEIGDILIDDLSGNNDGVFDPGETADICLIVSNTGDASISNLSGLAAILGGGETYLTLNNSETGSFSLEAKQVDTLKYSATADSGAPVGTSVYLNFNINDAINNFYSKTKDKKINIGEIPEVLISEGGTVITNNSLFYDSGGKTDNYSDNENYTITFKPEDANKSIAANFLSFSIESEANCGYDKLNIYNGLTTSDELIGTYCGTNSPGKVIATNTSGALTFVFLSDGYVIKSGWEAEIKSFVGYDYQVVVSGYGGFIEGATVEFNGITETTGIDGIAEFNNVPEGIDYPLIIIATGYDNFETTVNLFENTVDEVSLDVSKYDITFVIDDGYKAIEGATINFDGKNEVTDALGKFTFEVEYSLNKIYNISRADYDDLTGSVDVDGDKTIDLSMSSLTTYSVKFVTKDASSILISDVLVEFNSENKYTNASGEVLFTEIAIGENLNFSLKKENYWDYDSTLNVEDADVVFNAVLSSTTSIISVDKENIKIYPNPSNGIFNIEINNAENIKYSIKVFDVLGSAVYQKQINGSHNINQQIDLSTFAKGIYFLSVESEYNVVTGKRIIIK